MSTPPYTRAPHREGQDTHVGAPNAALLIDFDNVTMGMRSDLSKELKNLLQSEVIRGKVTVQRAYADWRRYPQYIVPLSEASIDLIFAPAYGSSKKNATDIRMAIDAIELVFVRPEIGTFILLTGDSDFSSLVLKLKEYGKYVIGVGIQESSSDILVQNCDEYYSYTSLTGLRKTTESEGAPMDPWVLVEKALQRMVERDDVMRSDRLKQVMLEFDAGFDEGSYGFSKFSKFLTEASSRGLVRLHKMENGQYEVRAGDGSGGRRSEPRERSSSRGGRERRGGNGSRRGREERSPSTAPADQTPAQSAEGEGDPLRAAYDLLRAALSRLTDGGEAVRDSDVKRKMLELDRSFDEAELGFSKFSRFLRQAHDHEVVDLRRRETGNYEVAPRGAGGPPEPEAEKEKEAAAASRGGRGEGGRGSRAPEREERTPAATAESATAGRAGGTDAGGAKPAGEPRGAGSRAEKDAEDAQEAPAESAAESALRSLAGRIGLRFGSRKGPSRDEPPPLLEGQLVEAPDAEEGKKEAAPPAPSPSGSGAGRAEPSRSERSRSEPSRSERGRAEPSRSERSRAEPSRSERSRPERSRAEPPAGGTPGAKPAEAEAEVDPADLGLPTDPDAQVRYLTNSYRGVGQKTAEALVDALGEDLFTVLQDEPDRVREVVPRTADQVLENWRTDFERRVSKQETPDQTRSSSPGLGPRRGSRGRRTRPGGQGGPSSAE